VSIKKLVRNYLHIVIAQIVTSVIAVILLKVSLKHVTAADYGNIVLILAASNTIQVFLNWTCSALVRYGVEEFIADKNIVNTFWARTFIFLLNLILILALAPLWFRLLHSFLDLQEIIKPLILLHIIVGSLWMHGQQALQAARRPQVQSYLLLAERALSLLVIIIIVNINWLSWEKIFWVLLSSSIVMFFISILILRPYIGVIDRVVVKSAMQKIFLFSIPLFPYAVTSFFTTNYLNSYFINAYLPKSDLTVFNTIFQITGLLTQLPILLNMLLMPQFVSMRLENKQENIKKYMETVLPFMTMAWGLGIGLAAFILTWFIPSFFGATFAGAAPAIILLSAGALFSFPSLVGYSPFIMSVSDVKVSFPMAIIAAVVNVVAHFLLIGPLGLAGSAIATLLSIISGLAFIVIYVSRKYSFQARLLSLSLLPAVVSITAYFFIGKLYVFIGCLTVFSLLFAFATRKQVLPYLNLAFKMVKPKESE